MQAAMLLSLRHEPPAGFEPPRRQTRQADRPWSGSAAATVTCPRGLLGGCVTDRA
eukprot:COSAG02_NODE_1773_length_10980_cov_8.196765_6_plen_55_part_00